MVSNRTKRNIYLAVAIVCTIGLFAILILKLCGIYVNMWLYGFDMGVLLVCSVCYSNFRQAVKEDDKYGRKQG